MKRPAKRRRDFLPRVLTCQPLEDRRVLAASLGWDGPGLGSTALTYYVANSPSTLSQAQTTAAIQTALNVWSSVVDITFTPTSQPGLRDSIDISFTTIDGGGGTLAQAYFPDDVNSARIAGDVQFDSSEVWEVGNALGGQAFDLVWVAVHEIGHSLGLDHLNATGSVLAPYVSPNQTFVNLSAADIAAALAVYAPATGTSSVSSAPSTTTVQTPKTSNPTDPGDSDNNPFPRSRWHRSGSWHRFGGRLEADVPANHNLYNPTDVNGDELTSPIDVLQIINYLNSSAHQTGIEIIGKCDTDADNDGLITQDELAASIAAARAAFFADYDLDADGSTIESNVSVQLWAKLSAADSNGDSSVSLSEFQSWAPQAPMPHHGGRGFVHHQQRGNSAIAHRVTRARH